LAGVKKAQRFSMEKPESYHFNYQALDKFLSREYGPKELGNQLDELMADLVNLASEEDNFGKALNEHHYVLRELRNIFWNLNKK
jgi:hypothetical protein